MRRTGKRVAVALRLAGTAAQKPIGKCRRIAARRQAASFAQTFYPNSLAGTLGNAFSCGTCRTEKLAVIQAYKGPIAFVSTAMQRALKASLGTGLRPCTFPILFRGQFALNPPVLVVMMVLTHLTLTGNRVALALYAIQLNATAFEVGLRSAEKSECQRFVKLRNEGKNESDTESKV
jgi:hypothetical protein